MASDAPAGATHELFGDAWAAAWRLELNASATYREAAARWEGPLVLAIAGGGGAWADLFHGECRAARAATPADLAQAPFVIRGEAETWRRLLAGKVDPLFALMGGKLKL